MPKTKRRRSSSKISKEDEPKQEEPAEADVFSLDSLLEVREQEKKDNTFDPINRDNEHSSDIEEVVLEPPKAPLERDGSIYAFCDYAFPMRIFDIINKSTSCDIHCIPKLSLEQWLLVTNCLDFVQPSQTLLFSLIQELIIKKQKNIGEIILNYTANFPDNSISYDVWFDFLKESIIVCEPLSAYILAIARPQIFENCSLEDQRQRNRELILLFIASITTPQSRISHPFCKIIDYFKKLLISVKLDETDITFIVRATLSLINDEPIASISSFISYFPFTSTGCRILGQISTILALNLLGSESDDVKELCSSIGKVKAYCDGFDNDSLIKASAVLALAERALSCAVIFQMINRSDVQSFVEGLQFNITNAYCQETLMIRIREQLHITRTQAELILTKMAL